MNARIERINELIKQHTNNIILKDLSLKDGVFITIAKVDTTPDLRYTRVFVSVFPEKEISYAMKTLEKEIFPSLIGEKLYGFMNDGLFLDIGTPDDFAKAGSFFKHRFSRNDLT